MNLGNTLITLFEVALVAFTIWAVFHEGAFVAFEERIITRIRRSRFRVIRGGNRVSKTYYPSSKNA